MIERVAEAVEWRAAVELNDCPRAIRGRGRSIRVGRLGTGGRSARRVDANRSHGVLGSTKCGESHARRPFHRGRPLGSARYSPATAGVTSAISGATICSPSPTPAVRAFAHLWPGTPNLGDISTIDWTTVQPVDALICGFPYQDVSTPASDRHPLRALVAQGGRDRPVATAIENVRGLLSAPAIRPDSEEASADARDPDDAIGEPATAVRNLEPDPWLLGDESTRLLRVHEALLGDLAGLRPTARWIGTNPIQTAREDLEDSFGGRPPRPRS